MCYLCIHTKKSKHCNTEKFFPNVKTYYHSVLSWKKIKCISPYHHNSCQNFFHIKLELLYNLSYRVNHYIAKLQSASSHAYAIKIIFITNIYLHDFYDKYYITKNSFFILQFVVDPLVSFLILLLIKYLLENVR